MMNQRKTILGQWFLPGIKKNRRTNNLFEESQNNVEQPTPEKIMVMSYITTCGGTPQARARPVRPAPSQTRPGVPCAVPPQSLQSCPRNNGATPATCARNAAQCSRSSRLSAGRTSRAPASSRGESPWEAPRRGKLLARRCQRIFSSQNGVKELTSKRRRRNGDSLWADHHVNGEITRTFP